MCKCNSESVDHLFLHCPVASELWDMIFGLFGVSWVMPLSIVGLFACQQGCFGRHRNGDIWKIVPLCLMWCIWRREIVDVLKTLSILCLISSFFCSEPYLTGSLCGETNLFLFWIYLTFVIFVLDLFAPVYFLCTWVPLSFDINESLLLIKKRKKFGYHESCKVQKTVLLFYVRQKCSNF